MTRARVIAAAFIVGVAVLAVAAPADARGARKVCIERSEVVGYQHCSRYGAWTGLAAWPAFALDVGMMSRVLHDGAIDSAATIDHTSYRIVGDATTIDTWAPRLRLTMSLGALVYIGGDLELGVSTTEPPRPAAEIVMSSRLVADEPSYVATHALLGLHAPVGPLILSGEFAAGVRAIGYAATNVRGLDLTSIDSTALDLQVRARAAIWLTPWLTVGATVGTSLVDRGDVSVAFEIGGHLRAFDGTR